MREYRLKLMKLTGRKDPQRRKEMSSIGLTPRQVDSWDRTSPYITLRATMQGELILSLGKTALSEGTLAKARKEVSQD